LGLQRVLGLKSYETAWAWLHKFRRAMVRPGRDMLTGRIEVDECYVGGPEEGLTGRLNVEKALVVVAAQEDGAGIGRIRLRQIVDASAQSLIPFVRESVVSGSNVHTDGWLGYLPLLPACSASRRSRSRNLGTNYSSRCEGDRETTTYWAYLSQADT
jgi:hypothetical protein